MNTAIQTMILSLSYITGKWEICDSHKPLHFSIAVPSNLHKKCLVEWVTNHPEIASYVDAITYGFNKLGEKPSLDWRNEIFDLVSIEVDDCPTVSEVAEMAEEFYASLEEKGN